MLAGVIPSPGVGLGRGLGAGALRDDSSSRPGVLEEKTNNLLLIESILRYTTADESHLDQDIDNPLLGGTGLLRGMDRSQLCPLPPALDGTTDTIDAGECGR